jgi:hypothetical protein
MKNKLKVSATITIGIILIFLFIYFLFFKFGLENDFKVLFKDKGIEVYSLKCSMLGSVDRTKSRSGICHANTGDSDVKLIIDKFKLEEITTGKFETSSYFTTDVSAEKLKEYDNLKENVNYNFYQSIIARGAKVGTCEVDNKFNNISKVKLFISKEKIQISNGSSFVYMLLYFNNELGQSCVQIEYSYG